MFKNTVKMKLNEGETVYGPFFTFTDATLAEFVTLHGWDFIVFDAEHGPIQPEVFGNLSRASEIRSVTPIVRTPGTEAHLVNRYLDSGAHGVMFPMINDASQATKAVQVSKYPPQGVRGLGLTRTNDFLLGGVGEGTIQHLNSEMLVITQVETQSALDNLGEVLSIEGIDVVFLGPVDLSTALGHLGDLDHPKVKRAIEYVAKSVLESGKVFGTFVTTSERAKYVRDELGARFIATDLGRHISHGCEAFLNEMKP